MSTTKQRQFRELTDALVEGTATSKDVERLSGLLRDDPEAQDAYLDFIDVHALLSWEFRGSDSAEQVSNLPKEDSLAEDERVVATVTRRWPRSGERSYRRTWESVVRVGLAMIVVAAIVIFFKGKPTDESQPDLAGSFCQLSKTVGGQWGSDRTVRVGERFGPQRLKLKTGIVEVTFDNGVRAVLAGPAELELVDSMNAWLHRGRVVFRVPPSAIGFTLETTEANVVDLGTEFGVHAGESVGTDVQVYEGEVVAHAKDDLQNDSMGKRLHGGQALRISTAGGCTTEELPFWPERFVRYMPAPEDRELADPNDSPRSPHNSPQHEELQITPAPTDVAIDGDLSDWNLKGQFSSRCDPPYDAFYHVNGAMMYDKEYLYIGADVGDPFPMRSLISPHERRKLYGNGGCLAFRLSTDRGMGWPARGQGPGTTKPRKMLQEDRNDRLVFLVLWYYAAEELPSLHVTYGMDWHGAKVNPSGYQGAFRQHADGKGYTAEYAIPWALLSAADDPPRAGDTLACTWLVHWSGPEGLNWKGQLVDVVNPEEKDWNFQNAAKWGRAIYRPPDNE